jgi:hypothetical protein
MSILTANGHLAPDQADAYTTALLSLLGDRDPVGVLRETPGALQRELERFPASALGIREAPGKWSARMVIAHLADSELVGAFRLRMILAHDRPPIAAYDQDAWAAQLGYEDTDVNERLERFTVIRRSNLEYWDGASPADLARVGVHGERGEESFERMRQLYAAHDLAHRNQLARIWKSVARQGGESQAG